MVLLCLILLIYLILGTVLEGFSLLVPSLPVFVPIILLLVPRIALLLLNAMI